MVRVNRLGTGGSTDCLHCGTHVTQRFARVFGDENGNVHRCQACDSSPRLSRGSAAGKSVDTHVDPLDQPTRNSGARVGAVETEGGDGR
ncbi:DUF7563 family protein [Halobaculum marinum]|uniref:DUF7563 family protein n=1 Tax=Halobaculum marinum TaxID=3031996 RepID=UPI003D80CE53